jgi:hypothetical protein
LRKITVILLMVLSGVVFTGIGGGEEGRLGLADSSHPIVGVSQVSDSSCGLSRQVSFLGFHVQVITAQPPGGVHCSEAGGNRCGDGFWGWVCEMYYWLNPEPCWYGG